MKINPKEKIHWVREGKSMRLLVCDDSPSFAEKIGKRLENCAETMKILAQIDKLSDPAQMQTMEMSPYDMAFLDVDLGPISGIELAKRLRNVRKDAVILFVTNFIQYAPEGYEVQAFRYLVKSQLEQKLPRAFELAVEHFRQEHQEITIKVDAEKIAVPVACIQYIVAQDHLLTVKLWEQPRESYTFYGTMIAMENTLQLFGFLRVTKSYLVNMAAIKRLQYDGVTLRSGEMLPVSGRRYAELKQKYLNWEGQSGWGKF